MPMLQLEDISDRYKTLFIKKNLLEKELKTKTFKLNVANRKLKHYEEARAIFVRLSRNLQTEAKKHIERITTMALQTVFDDRYSYQLVYEEKRSVMTCTPVVKIGNKEYVPKEDQGGGAQDTIGFIQKIILWSIQVPRSRNFILLDEPFRFCGDLTMKALEIVKKLSQKLNLQILIITHEPEIANACDRVWLITNPKDRSIVKRIK